MAGMRGFEPLNGGTKTRCLTAWRHPNKLQKFTLHNLNCIGKLNFQKNLTFFIPCREVNVFPAVKKFLLLQLKKCLPARASMAKKSKQR